MRPITAQSLEWLNQFGVRSCNGTRFLNAQPRVRATLYTEIYHASVVNDSDDSGVSQNLWPRLYSVQLGRKRLFL